jgi:plasmid replication initiation protein
MYELLNQYKVIGKRTIEIEELKTLLNIPDSYKNNDISRLIKSIKKELTSKSDLTFDFEVIKESRQFKSFEFTIKYNKKENLEPNKILNVKDKIKSLKI